MLTRFNLDFVHHLLLHYYCYLSQLHIRLRINILKFISLCESLVVSIKYPVKLVDILNIDFHSYKGINSNKKVFYLIDLTYEPHSEFVRIC